MAQLSLEHIKGSTYYIPSPTNVGVYVDNGKAILMDSGNDKEAGRRILKLLNQQELELKLIINTHSNADHIGGNQFLQEKTGCDIAAAAGEVVFIANPELEPAFLFGAFPHKDMRNKFLMAKPSRVTSVIPTSGNIPGTELEAIPLPGHYFDMVGIRTPDNVLFIADSLFPENIITKYHLFYLLDIRSHMVTLDNLGSLQADVFLPSHGQPQVDLTNLIELNRNKIVEIMGKIEGFCTEPCTTDEILQKVCQTYDVTLNVNQYVLLSSTIRSYLSYLYEEGRVECLYEDYRMLWSKK